MEVVLYVVYRDGAGYECLRMYQWRTRPEGRGRDLRKKEGGRKSRKNIYLVADAADGCCSAVERV